MNSRRWVGRSGRIIQIMFAVMYISLVAVMLYGTIIACQSGVSSNVILMFIILWLAVAGLVFVVVWAIRYMSPMMVVMDDWGLMLRCHGVVRSIEWGDVEAVSYYRPEMYQGCGFVVYPKSEYFVKMGQKVPGEYRLSLQWSIPQMSFSPAQLREIFDSFLYFAWRTGRTPDALAGQRPLPGPARSGRVEVFGG